MRLDSSQVTNKQVFMLDGRFVKRIYTKRLAESAFVDAFALLMCANDELNHFDVSATPLYAIDGFYSMCTYQFRLY